MNTAQDKACRVRWRIKNNKHSCAMAKCNQPLGPTYLGLAICWKHYDLHVGEDSRFSLARYAEGENSKFVLYPGLKGIKTLELTNEEGLVDTINAGDSVAWCWYGKTHYGKVHSITGKDAETVNRVKKSCPISDAVVIWVKSGGKKLGLVAEQVIALQESDEEDETPEVPDTIDELLDQLC